MERIRIRKPVVGVSPHQDVLFRQRVVDSYSESVQLRARTTREEQRARETRYHRGTIGVRKKSQNFLHRWVEWQALCIVHTSWSAHVNRLALHSKLPGLVFWSGYDA